MQKKLIYVVEDEKNIQELLKYNLEDAGYKIRVFSNGETFIDESNITPPDLVLLDIMMPGIDGLEVCKKIKSSTRLRRIPIIMLSAKGEEIDKVLGLEIGAEDYITKPFALRELIARIKVVFRRQGDESQDEAEVISFGDVRVDFSRREVYKGEALVELTYKEFELLKMLLKNKRKVLTREKILESIWGMDYYGETRTVDVHIRYLRQKLERDDKNPEYIETLRGIGYRFNDTI
jgi:two-component system alkaline phosphatase synthesis response regulator PhoP